MPQRNEAKLVKKARIYLNKLDRSYFFKIHGSAAQVAGISDLIGCYHGKFVALEFKDPNNPKGPTPRQILFLKRVKRAGGKAYVVRSMTDVKRVFK